MADPPDPTLPGWARGVIAIIREPPMWALLTVLASAIALWTQQHNQHKDTMEQRERQHVASMEETKANGEKLQKIEAKLPSRVYLGSGKE